MAISLVGIAREILLVIVFGGVKSFKGDDLGDDGTLPKFGVV